MNPGKRQKTGGRKKGTPNRVTADIKTRIAALIDSHFETVETNLSLLDPKEHVTAYIKLLAFVLPVQKEQKVDLSTKLDQLTDDQLNALIDQILKNP